MLFLTLLELKNIYDSKQVNKYKVGKKLKVRVDVK